jgi:uncharacterized protein YoxC
MNKLRRKEIFKLIQKLHQLSDDLNEKNLDQIISAIEDITYEIQMLLDEEEDSLDNTPENLRSSIRYEESENACDNLSDAIVELEDLDDEYSIGEIKDYILNAINNLENCI